MKQLNSPDGFSLTEVAQHLHVHIATVYRWVFRGVRGRRLRTYMVGGRRFVTQAALDLFLQASEPPLRSDSQHRAQLAQANLAALGVPCKENPSSFQKRRGG